MRKISISILSSFLFSLPTYSSVIMRFLRLQQQNQVHCCNSNSKPNELNEVLQKSAVFKQILPDVCCNKNKVSCYKHQHITFCHIVNFCNSQTNKHSNQRNQVHKSVAKNSLNVIKWVCHQDSDITYFSGDFMSNDGDQDRNKYGFVTSGKGDSQGKPIHEVVNQWAEQVEVSGGSFSFEVFPAGLTVLVVRIRLFFLSMVVIMVMCMIMKLWGGFFVIFVWTLILFKNLIIWLEFNNSNTVFFIWSLVFFVMNFARMVMMLDSAFMVVVAFVIMPVFMGNSAWMEESFQNQEKYDRSDKDSGDYSEISFFLLVGDWQDVNHGISE